MACSSAKRLRRKAASSAMTMTSSKKRSTGSSQRGDDAQGLGRSPAARQLLHCGLDPFIGLYKLPFRTVLAKRPYPENARRIASGFAHNVDDPFEGHGQRFKIRRPLELLQGGDALPDIGNMIHGHADHGGHDILGKALLDQHMGDALLDEIRKPLRRCHWHRPAQSAAGYRRWQPAAKR